MEQWTDRRIVSPSDGPRFILIIGNNLMRQGIADFRADQNVIKELDFITLSGPGGGAKLAPPGINCLLCFEKCRYELQTS